MLFAKLTTTVLLALALVGHVPVANAQEQSFQGGSLRWNTLAGDVPFVRIREIPCGGERVLTATINGRRDGAGEFTFDWVAIPKQGANPLDLIRVIDPGGTVTSTNALMPAAVLSPVLKVEVTVACDAACKVIGTNRLVGQVDVQIVATDKNDRKTVSDFITAKCVLGGGGLPPPPPPGVNGDPHFRTFSGDLYDFMGACDLHLIHAPSFGPNGEELTIDIRTKIRENYSYIESAVVRIGDETLEVDSYGQYFLNGVDGAVTAATTSGPGRAGELATISGYAVNRTMIHQETQKQVIEIIISKNEKIVLTNIKDFVAVDILSTNSERFGDSKGMLGDFSTGVLYARDGVTVLHNPIKIAAEWQVRDDEPMLFQVSQEPQFPRQCQMPNAKIQESRKLRFGNHKARAKAEAACSHVPEYLKEDCITDVILTNDENIAQAEADI